MNLSALAIRHGALTLFAMIAVAAAGVWAYASLGRAEDPPFTIKNMVIIARWPGASPDLMAREVTDRLVRKLEELSFLDNLDSQTTAGVTTLTLALRDSTPPRRVGEL